MSLQSTGPEILSQRKIAYVSPGAGGGFYASAWGRGRQPGLSSCWGTTSPMRHLLDSDSHDREDNGSCSFTTPQVWQLPFVSYLYWTFLFPRMRFELYKLTLFKYRKWHNRYMSTSIRCVIQFGVIFSLYSAVFWADSYPRWCLCRQNVPGQVLPTSLRQFLLSLYKHVEPFLIFWLHLVNAKIRCGPLSPPMEYISVHHTGNPLMRSVQTWSGLTIVDVTSP